MEKTSDVGKECCSTSEITMPSSVAAAYNSRSKLTQKRLLNAKPQARIDAIAPWRVNNQLHAAGLIEESLGDELRLGWE